MKSFPIAVAIVVACAPQRATLPFGVEREIGGDAIDRYEVDLTAGQVWIASFDQLGADVVITTFAPDGKQLASYDSPTGGKGSERVQIDAHVSGRYRIDVGSFPGQRGRYRARLEEIITREELARREAAKRAEVEVFFTKQQPFVDAFLAWAKQSAARGVEGVGAIIGDARVVVLAEAEHGKREYLAYRNRFAKHLVEQHGVTAIVVESGFTETTVADDYVAGSPAVAGKDAAAAVFSWGMPVAIRENLELVEWLRTHNQSAKRKVRLYGMDLTGGRDGLYKESRRAIDAALAVLADPALAARFAPLLDHFNTAAYLDLTDARRGELARAIADLVKALEARPGTSPELVRARRNAAIARTLEEFFAQTRATSTKEDLADASLLGIRDTAMAANVLWALEHEGADGRIFVFTHNNHARRAPLVMWPTKNPIAVSMGQHLAKRLGDQLVVIGSTHGDGEPTATIDELMTRVGIDDLVVDLRAATDPTIRAGLDRDWNFRLDGWEVWGGVPWWTANPVVCFDALVHTRTSTLADLVK